MRPGGHVVVEMLAAHAVPRVFTIPGESFLAVLDGLWGSAIETIVCRHEGAAAMMAEASGKLTGRPGVAIVTRGPGATNASAGVHVAMQDSTPMILLIGQIATTDRGREAFQEVDLVAFFRPLAKWAAEVSDTSRLPEYLNRAFHVAMSGRPGPVVLSLPEDVLNTLTDTPVLAPTAPARTGVDAEQIEEILARLARMKRPLIIAGGSDWNVEAADDLARFAKANALPVAVSFRRQDHVDNRLPSYVGDLGVGMNPRLGHHLRQADGLVLLGTRLGDTATAGYDLVDPAAPGKVIVHVHPDPNLPGSVYRSDLTITASAKDVVARLAKAKPVGNWSNLTAALRHDYENWQVPHETPGDVKLEQVIRWLSDNLPEDAIVTNGAGNYASFLHRYFRFKSYGTQLAPTSGSMGYGFPAAIAAKLSDPSRLVVCLAGDGCFQMTLNEFSTAMQYDAGVITLVCNNGQYGTIRTHQERHFPARVSGTALANPDFAALAQAYGGFGATVRRTEDFPAAFAEARASGKPALIELVLDPEALTSSKTMTEIRENR